MKPLDNYETWAAKLSEENAAEIGLDIEECRMLIKELMEIPIDRSYSVLKWYVGEKWADAFRNIKADAPIEVLELASGESTHIPKVMAKHYSDSQTKYITFNLNKKLTANFKTATKDLPITIEVVEDPAQTIDSRIGENKIDVVVFEHAINDILQGMFAERNGIDTIDTDWYDVLPKMVEIISSEYRGGTFEASVRNEFLALLDSCLNVLKPNGYIVFFHHMYKMDLDFGYDAELYENMVNIVRKWVQEAGIGQEVFFDGFEPHWWMFIKKI